MPVSKPTPGATGWNTAVDAVIDIANSVADLPTRVTALEAGGIGDVTEAELAAGLATKAPTSHVHADLLDQATGDNRYILQTNANAFAPAEATANALAALPFRADNVTTAGAAVGQIPVVTGTSPTTFGLAATQQATKADVGLGNVDNTSDAAKPVSTLQQAALDAKLTKPSSPAATSLVTVDSSGTVGTRTLPDIQVFTASGTWTKPSGATKVTVLMFGGGSGGGSGARRASGTACSGGAGGSGGAFSQATLRASDLGSTEAVTVGSGGAGGAAVTTDDTNGNPGSSGGASQFGASSKVRVSAGGGGGGGQAGASSTAAGATTGFATGGASAAGVSGAAGTAASTSGYGGCGGGSGGGISTTPAAFAGGAGANGSMLGGGGGTAGPINTVGGAGASASAGMAVQGGGGAGGGGSITGAGGAGGAGGNYGGGGGGGGSSLNGSASGAGGAGGVGIVMVVSE